MKTATVSGGFARNLLEYALRHGADPGRLRERSGIGREEVEDFDARIPLANYIALMRAAKSECGQPALGLYLGATRDFRDFSVVGLICYAAATMGDALKELNRYSRLVAEFDVMDGAPRFEIVRRGDGMWMVDRRHDPEPFPEMTESTWSRFISETRRHFPEAPFAIAVHVAHSAPDHADVYERALGVPVTFASDWNAIQIDPNWLSIRLHNPSAYAFGVLSERADALMRELESARSVRGQVEARLMPMLHRGEVSMRDLAKDMGLSRQTLYRRLRDEGVTFEAVLDDLRRQLAEHYLRAGRISVNEAGYLIGFSDPGSFSRAFKRWTGLSPREWMSRQD